MSSTAADPGFAERFRSEVIERARNDGGTEAEPAFLEEAFTALAIEYLAEAGMVIDGSVNHFERTVAGANARADGYYIDEDEEGRLDLFVSIFHGGDDPPSVSRDEIVRAVKQGVRCVKHALDGFHKSMEPSDAAVPMLRAIYDHRTELNDLRIFVLTDAVAQETEMKADKGVPVLRAALGEVKAKVQVWDIDRFSRSAATGGTREPIEVDVERDFGALIPCLPVDVPGASYRSYLAVLPGRILHQLYEDYGERLLEMNVRSFLQARGKINKGIRATILDEPEQFFAYNNGITAVADHLETREMPGGGMGISRIHGLQIVNGGQTTASVHRAVKKDRAENRVSVVAVQAKISVVPPENMETMVARISRCANSQNKVSDADFSANDPFHQRLEELSRTLWTPDGQSHWFYERARGQYQVARFKEGKTKVAQRAFDAQNPASQMFTKTDLSSFVHSWQRLPHLVSRGSQKNFQEFTIRARKTAVTPDADYFKELVAQAVIFRAAQRFAREQQISPFRANVVTYAVSYLANFSGTEVQLREIWDRQALSPVVASTLSALLRPVFDFIVETSRGKNPTEWCKRPECWELLSAASLLPGSASRA